MATLMGHHVKCFFNSPLTLLLLFLPIVANCFLMVMGGQNKEVTPRLKVGIVIYEEQVGSEVLKEELKRALAIEDLTLKEAEHQLQQGKIEGFLFVDTPTLLQHLRAGNKVATLLVDENSPYKGQIEIKVQDAFQVLKELVEEWPSEELERKFEKSYSRFNKERGTVQLKKQEEQNKVDTQNFGMFVYVFTFMCILSLNSVMEERQTKVYERMCTTPLQKWEYLIGHLLGAFILLGIQILVEALVFEVMGINVGLTFIQLVLFSFLFGLIGLAISFFVLGLTHTLSTYAQVATFIVAPLCMISDCLFPMSFLPPLIVKLSYLSPIRWGMMAYRSTLAGASALTLLIEVGGAIGLASLFIGFSLLQQSSATKSFLPRFNRKSKFKHIREEV